MQATTSDRKPSDTCSREELGRRIDTVIEWLLEETPRLTLLQDIQAKWDLTRRTAQNYVRVAEKRLAAEAERDNRLAQLRRSQIQRERLINQVFSHFKQPDADPKQLSKLNAFIQSACKLLDSRDRAAAEIHQLTGSKSKPPAQISAEASRISAQARMLDIQVKEDALLLKKLTLNQSTELPDESTIDQPPQQSPNGQCILESTNPAHPKAESQDIFSSSLPSAPPAPLVSLSPNINDRKHLQHKKISKSDEQAIAHFSKNPPRKKSRSKRKRQRSPP